jgi:ElaB/YqjD/DUF883 family membrane-anchored ribosome-binding protein
MQQTDRADDFTSIQNTAQSQARNSGSKLDNIKTTVADKLESAAEALRQKSGQSSNRAGYVNQASDWLNQTADYVRGIEPAQIKSDIQQQVHSNPGRSLLIAGAAGLALGILLRRR